MYRDQVAASRTVAGPNAARYRSITSSTVPRPSSSRPSQACAVVPTTSPRRDHNPRGGTCTKGAGCGRRRPARLRRRSGTLSASAARAASCSSVPTPRSAPPSPRTGRGRHPGRGARGPVREQLLGEDRLGEATEEEAVVGIDDVDGAALHHQPHDPLVRSATLQRADLEVVEARPEPDVRIARLLRLQPDEVADRRRARRVGALAGGAAARGSPG